MILTSEFYSNFPDFFQKHRDKSRKSGKVEIISTFLGSSTLPDLSRMISTDPGKSDLLSRQSRTFLVPDLEKKSGSGSRPIPIPILSRDRDWPSRLIPPMVAGRSGHLSLDKTGGLRSTKEAFLLPTQQPWIQIWAPLRFFLFTA